MTDIKLTNFRRITDMPERIVSACKRMGHGPSYLENGHLIELVENCLNPRHARTYSKFRSAYVLEADGKVVGWVCLYDWKYEGTPWVSVWVKHRYRRKGYGKILMAKAWKQWNHIYPRAVKKFGEYWSKRRGRQMDIRRIRQLSPNACVNPSDSSRHGSVLNRLNTYYTD